MRVQVNAVVLCASATSYKKDGKPVVFRNLWVSTGPAEEPTQVRVPSEDPGALDAFEEIQAVDWLAQVPLVLEFGTYGREKTQSVTLVGLQVPGGK